MKTQNNPPQVRHNDSYLISLHSKVPASFKQKLTNEALARGISVSEYACCLLLNAHQNGEKQSAELTIALQEKETLKNQIQQLQEQIPNAMEQEILTKLRKNRKILTQFSERGITTKEQLQEAGFDPTCLNGVRIHDKKLCNEIIDMGYTLEGETVTIHTL